MREMCRVALCTQIVVTARIMQQSSCILKLRSTTSTGLCTKTGDKQRYIYVEIKCQLDATEVLIADLIACSTCFGHHYTHHQEFKSIIQWLLPVVFRAVVFQVAGLVWRVMCPVCRMLLCGNKMQTRCNRGSYYRSYCLLNMFRAPLCPTSGAQEYYIVVAAYGISCCVFQVVILVWS